MKYFFLLTILSLQALAVTESEVLESVQKHFPLIEEAELKYRASVEDARSARGAFDHKIVFKSRNRIEEKYDNNYFEATIERQTALNGLGLIAGQRQGIGHFPAYDGKYETSGAGEIFAGISLPLLRNFSSDELRLEANLTRIKKEQTHTELQLKKNLYAHKALSVYYKWLLSNKVLQIRKEALEIANERQEMLGKKFSAGDIEKIKLNDGLRSLDKRRDELTKSMIENKKYSFELSLYLRNSDGSPRIVESIQLESEGLPKIRTTNFVEDTLPQIRILKLEREIREAEKKFYSQSVLPGLDLQLLGAKELSGNRPYDPESLQIGVKFDLPLENNKAEGKNVSASYKLQALDRQLRYVSQELRTMYDFVTLAQLQSKERWQITSREFENTRKMAQAERVRFTQGASDLFTVNLREQDVFETHIKLWTIWYEANQYALDGQLYAADFTKRPVTSK